MFACRSYFVNYQNIAIVDLILKNRSVFGDVGCYYQY